ncbi:MAG: ketoacyl-ACP synthase III [Candidatus Planktophila sp.]|jgi:3-oxoacyl-(acyl-carrier-protein) synthase III|nr:ketoacyl-ACP synthase III [Candidatus Planktophila sp.]
MSIKLPAVGNSQILSVGSYRPKRLVPNSEIVDRIESSDEWIVQRTGIQSRRFAGPEEGVISMAMAACEMALERAHMSMADIDTVILATISYPFQAPSAATELVALLGNPKAAAVDISAACAGFCYGVAMASDLVRTGNSKNVLVIGVEKLSDFTDPNDRATAFIFADGAGAVIIGASDQARIGPTIWGSDADSRDTIMLTPAYTEFRNAPEKGVAHLGWPNIAQQGQAVYRWAVFTVSKAGIKALEAAGVRADELGAFIPHQANMRIIESMAKEINIPESVITADDIRVNGNTSAASIPLAMDALLLKHPELHGTLALLIGYGAGLVYAAQVVALPPAP